MSKKIQTTVRDLATVLEKDCVYRSGWRANIAMAFIDEYNRTKRRENINSRSLHRAANRAADNFIDTLCNTILSE